MKKSARILVMTLLAFIFLASASWAQVDLYLQDSLTLQLDIRGELSLIANSQGASVKKAQAELFLFPKDSNRQQVLFQSDLPKLNALEYSWDDQELGTKTFRYSAKVLTKDRRQEVRSKIPFPITSSDGVEEYLKETKTIDSLHPEIVAKAAELAEGEDDLFKVAFKLASWVEENVKYDLNTLTEKASQKASWVLQNRQGVCDEMTSLFIAMARAVGIPARFVKGISYSNSPLFSNPWQPHGWAEVYFPNLGWVSFDVTFGEYGYIDVTHISLRDSFDPQDYDATYNWVAQEVELQAKPLDLQVLVKDRGQRSSEEINLEYQLFNQEVGFGSYNLIKATLTNKANYYAATTLQLAVPPELEIIGRNKRVIMLEPNEVRETFRIIKVPEDLNKDYIYTFPALIYSEKNVTFRNEFTALENGPHYSRKEIEKLTIINEDKSYSRQVSFNCQGQEQLKLGEIAKISCQIRNSGNANLEEVNFCLEKNCGLINLPINQIVEKKISLLAEKPGWNKVFVTAENQFIEKRSSFNYAVLDEPKATISFKSPKLAKLNSPAGSDNALAVIINKESFSLPQKVEITLTGPGLKINWQASEIKQTEQIKLDLQQARLGFKNKFVVKMAWQDLEKKKCSSTKTIIIPSKPENYRERARMIFNTLLNFF